MVNKEQNVILFILFIVAKVCLIGMKFSFKLPDKFLTVKPIIFRLSTPKSVEIDALQFDFFC